MRSNVLLATLLAGAGMLSSAGTARADLDDAGREVETELYRFTDAVVYGKSEGDTAAPRFALTADDCRAVIERGKALGISPTQVMAGNPDSYLFKRAGAKCDEYGTWKGIVEAAAYLGEAATHHRIAIGMEPGSVTAQWANDYAQVGRACLVELDKREAAGLVTDVEVAIGTDKLTLAAARAKYCQGLVDWAGSFAKATEQARADADEKIRSKYTKAGVKGDRLKLLVEYDNTYLYGKGCDAKLTEVKQLAKAKLLFVWLEKSDGTPALRRYQLKGNKLVKETYREFSTREAAYRWCK